VWPGIVEESMWRACERRLRDPARAVHYTGSVQVYLLSGLAVCGICGQRLKSGTQTHGRTLKCTTGPGRHVNRRAERVEEFVVEVILARLRRPDAIHLVQPRRKGPDLHGLREEAQRLRTNLEGYAEDAGAGRLSRHEFYAMREAADCRLGEINHELAEAGRSDVMAQFTGSTKDPAEVWETLSLSGKRAAIDALAVVRVFPGRKGRPAGGLFDADSVFIDWRS
jgi:hypothetical protein